MTSFATVLSDARPAPDSMAGAAATQALAAALVHLLARDGDRPARWLSPGFAGVVEACRAELAATRSVRELPTTPRGEAMSFEGAVARLARDPADVALAIRRLELARLRRLPAWSDLVRTGLPAGPSDLDASLWFG